MSCVTEPEIIRVIADDRENAGGVIAELRERIDVALTVQRLVLGDFVVGETHLIERKTVRDFAVSIVDARLFRQVAAMAAGRQKPILILEGTAAAAAELGVSRESMHGALITVAVFYGVAVLRSKDPAETAQLIVYVGRQARRVAHDAHPRPGYRPKGRRARQLYILQGLPGIGPDRAARLLDHFGSVQAVATASYDDLAGVDGIGPATAERMRWALGD